jgi:hypothetical protein
MAVDVQRYPILARLGTSRSSGGRGDVRSASMAAWDSYPGCQMTGVGEVVWRASEGGTYRGEFAGQGRRGGGGGVSSAWPSA